MTSIEEKEKSLSNQSGADSNAGDEVVRQFNPRQVALAAMALALILVVQALGAPKPVTAVCVNSIFILICHKLRLRAVLTVALTSPIFAILTGHMPAAMAPMGIAVAFANMAYVYCYFQFMKSNSIKKYCFAPAAKALVMIAGAIVIVQILNWPSSTMTLLLVFGASQFPTGLGGIWGGRYLADRISLPGEFNA
jgi:hypothetical protein